MTANIDWRVFYAHPKKTPRDIDADAAVIARQLRTALTSASIEGTVEVTTGRDDFHARSTGWREWPASVTDKVFGEPRFNLIIVCAEPGTSGGLAFVGRGTSEILHAAETRGVPIRLWHGMDTPWAKNVTFRKCAPLETWNANDWQRGWRLTAHDWSESAKAIYRDRKLDTDNPY